MSTGKLMCYAYVSSASCGQGDHPSDVPSDVHHSVIVWF